MLLVVISVSILLLAIVLNFQSFMTVVKTIFGAFSPVISGAVFAYLLNPLMNFMDRRLYPALLRRKMPEKKAYRLSRVLSLIFALLFALVLVYEFFSMLLPQLTESITGIFNNMSTYYAGAEKWVLASWPTIPPSRHRWTSSWSSSTSSWRIGLTPISSATSTPFSPA